VCIYSITSRSSFNDIQNITKYLSHQRKSCGVPSLIVGNKNDMSHERRVETAEGLSLATSVNGTFCELSVSDNHLELEKVVNKFLKENCNEVKSLAPQSRMLSSRSSPEIRNKTGSSQQTTTAGGIENGVENEVKVERGERKGRALWQKLRTNNDIKKKK